MTAADDLRGGGPDGAVAVISYAFWQLQFGGAASAIGAPLTIEGKPFTIVGVTPPEFFGAEVGRWFDVAVPIGTEPLMRGRVTNLDQPGLFWLSIMIRLKPGQSIEAATEALRRVQPEVRAATVPPDADAQQRELFIKDLFVLTAAANGPSVLRRQYERPLVTLLGVAGLVLLVACANIANLLLARATTRHHELSVRVALGASRWRLVRLLLVEGVMLAVVGSAAGLLVARWSSRLLVAQLSTITTRIALDLSLDWRMMAFTATTTIVTALLAGTAAAVRAGGAAPMDALKDRGTGSAGRGASGTHGGVSSALVVAQVALSLVLVAGAGLFVRTFARLAATPLGFDVDRVLVANINATRSTVPSAARFDLYQRIADTVSEVPGISYAAGSLITPVTGDNWWTPLEVPGAPDLSEADRRTDINIVTPRWFATYGMRVVAGRDFDARDRAHAERVAIVNEEFAARFFPGRQAVGGLVAFPATANVTSHEPRTIVGVVTDAVYRSLREPKRPALYEPLAQHDWPFPFAGISLSVRSAAGSPRRHGRTISRAITEVDPNLAFSLRSVSDYVDGSLTQERIVAMLSGFFGGLALLLAGLGLYGVTSYAVTRRRTELGIRMALGAAPNRIVRLVLSRVLLLVGIGVLVGTGVSLWASRFVAALLYGLEPRDPTTLIGAIVVLASVGALAGLLPAWRASRIHPAVVLRES